MEVPHFRQNDAVHRLFVFFNKCCKGCGIATSDGVNDLYVILLQCVTSLRYIMYPNDRKCQRLFSIFVEGSSFAASPLKLSLDLLMLLD